VRRYGLAGRAANTRKPHSAYRQGACGCGPRASCNALGRRGAYRDVSGATRLQWRGWRDAGKDISMKKPALHLRREVIHLLTPAQTQKAAAGLLIYRDTGASCDCTQICTFLT
jgi:hypothetical protein